MSKKTEDKVDSQEELGKKTGLNQESDTISESDTSDAVDEISALKADLAEINDKYIRMYSEFDNYKRRTSRERLELMQNASKEVVVSLLPVLDDFERAEKSFESTKDLVALKEGVKLVHHKMKSILEQKGLEAMQSIGKIFDVDFHEAITNVPAPSPDLIGKVIDEAERGYTMNDKVVRFAKVVVGE